jgi:hypothetical protein
MPNANYQPDAVGDAVMRVLRDEQRATPGLIRAETDFGRREINNALTDLVAAGWVSKRHRGLYDYEADPRVSERAEQPARAETRRESGPVSHARDALADWQPTDVDTATARQATVATVGWLAAQDQPQRKAAIADWYADAELPLAFSTAWQKAIRPGLGVLREQGLVDHRTNVGWRVLDGEKK